MVIQKRTRQEIRQSVGYNLGALHVGAATSTPGSSGTTTLLDTILFGGNDIYNGRYIWFYNDVGQSTNREVERRVSDYATGGTLTIQAAPATTTDEDKYEMWDGYSPTLINEFINQAILDVTGQVYDPLESLSLHSNGYDSRFDLPSDFAMVNKIQMRDKMQWASLHTCGTAFDGAAVSNFTSSVDTEDKKQGTGSVKFKLDDSAGVAAGAILTTDISSKDISKYDYLEFWIKSSIATSSANLKISLDNTANCVSPLETLDIPALSADTWTYVRLQLSTPELDTAIISIGLEQDVDIGGGAAYYLWLDDIKVVANNTITWEDVPSQLWRVDKAAQDIVFTTDGVSYMGYKLLKIKGGDKPALLTSDSAASEIDDGYVINKATALALSSQSGSPATDPDARRQQATFYFGMSEQNKRAFPFLTNVRTAS